MTEMLSFWRWMQSFDAFIIPHLVVFAGAYYFTKHTDWQRNFFLLFLSVFLAVFSFIMSPVTLVIQGLIFQRSQLSEGLLLSFVFLLEFIVMILIVEILRSLFHILRRQTS